MELDALRETLSWFLLLPGAVFCVIGAVGLLRMPDLYSRIHGAGVTDTLGAGLILLGLLCFPAHWTASVKLVGILSLLYLTSATATHALSHAAYTSGQAPLLGDDASPQKAEG